MLLSNIYKFEVNKFFYFGSDDDDDFDELDDEIDDSYNKVLYSFIRNV